MEFRVTIVANGESGQINGESGQINGERGTMNGERGTINGESGQIKLVKAYDIESQDNAVLEIIFNNPGIKLEAIFLKIKTSNRSVRRMLERLSSSNKIEYRGSKRTGGWFIKT